MEIIPPPPQPPFLFQYQPLPLPPPPINRSSSGQSSDMGTATTSGLSKSASTTLLHLQVRGRVWEESGEIWGGRDWGEVGFSVGNKYGLNGNGTDLRN